MRKVFAVILILLLLSLVLEYKLGISDYQLVPVLQNIMDAVHVVPVKNQNLKTVFSKGCYSSFTIDSKFIHKEQWQPMENIPDTHNVFSAYYHKIGSSPIIKIIGNFNRYYKPKSLYCQLWYIDNAGSPIGSMIYANASVHKLRDGGGSR